MGDARDVKRRIAIGRAVDAGVIAERALVAQIVVVDVTFQNELGLGGNDEVDGARAHQSTGLPRSRPANANSSSNGGSGAVAA